METSLTSDLFWLVSQHLCLPVSNSLHKHILHIHWLPKVLHIMGFPHYTFKLDVVSIQQIME